MNLNKKTSHYPMTAHKSYSTKALSITNPVLPHKHLKNRKLKLSNKSAEGSPQVSFKKQTSTFKSTIHSSISSFTSEPSSVLKAKPIHYRLSSALPNVSRHLSLIKKPSISKKHSLQTTQRSIEELTIFKQMNEAIEFDANAIKRRIKKMIPQYENKHNRSSQFVIKNKGDFEVRKPSVDKEKVLFTRHNFISLFVIKNHADMLLYWDQYSKMGDTDFYRRRTDIIKKFDILKANTNDDRWKDLNENGNSHRKSFGTVRKNSRLMKRLSHSIEQKAIKLNKKLNHEEYERKY